MPDKPVRNAPMLEPLPSEIAKMSYAEAAIEERRMRDSGEFEGAIRQRDHWQQVADAWLKRRGLLTRRMVEVLSAERKKQEENGWE